MDYAAELCYSSRPGSGWLDMGGYLDVLPVGILGRSVLPLVLKVQSLRKVNKILLCVVT